MIAAQFDLSNPLTWTTTGVLSEDEYLEWIRISVFGLLIFTVISFVDVVSLCVWAAASFFNDHAYEDAI